MAKKFCCMRGELPFSGEKEMVIWDNLKTKSMKELKSGKYLYEFLRLGFSAVEIDYIIDLRPSTIEKRCIEFLKQKDENYEEFKFLFEECSGLPRITDTNIYLRSSYSSLKEFCDIEGLSYDDFKKFMEDITTVQYVKQRLDERTVRLQRKKNNSCGRFCKKTKWSNSGRSAIHLA